MVVADGRAHTGQAFRLGRVAVEPGRTPATLPNFLENALTPLDTGWRITVGVFARTVGVKNNPYGRGLAQGAASRVKP